MCRAKGVRVFSSNYTLYGDMSARANAVYRDFSPTIEIYSIDESFLDLSDVRADRRLELARDLRATVRAWTGIPTCVGIGPTKTLAKLANHIAKRIAPLDGVCDLTDPAEYDHWLCRIPAGEVWGIGRASLAKLEAMGVDSVADLADLDPRPVRKALTVVGERIIHELRGLSCLPLGALPAQRKGCAVTRSFSTRIEDRATLEQAVSAHATRLGEKLRREGLGTNHVSVFYHTSEHDRGAPMRSVSTTVTLPEATNDTLALIRAARLGVAKTWREPGARAMAVQQGRHHHHRPDAARRQPARSDRPARPRALRPTDGGDRRLQRSLRPRQRRPGSCGPRSQTDVEHEVRDADAALHDAAQRVAGRINGVMKRLVEVPTRLRVAVAAFIIAGPQPKALLAYQEKNESSAGSMKIIVPTPVNAPTTMTTYSKAAS